MYQKYLIPKLDNYRFSQPRHTITLFVALIFAKMMEFHFGKGENTSLYQHFHIFLQCFQKPSCTGILKSGLCGNGINILILMLNE